MKQPRRCRVRVAVRFSGLAGGFGSLPKARTRSRRQGSVLWSASPAVDLLSAELAAREQEARNALQLRLLEGRALCDATAALAYLRALPEVDKRRTAFGRTPDDGHNLPLAGVSVWETDVFAFLDDQMRQ